MAGRSRKGGETRGTWLRTPGDEADAERLDLARTLAPHELEALGSYYWEGWARDEQLPPREAWRTWLIRAGRGFGKTRAGAEWVRDVARKDGNARIALVGASLAEVRSVMVEGDSGVLAAAPGALAPVFEPSLRKLTWENGAVAWLYSAGEPDSLRGPQHTFPGQSQKEFYVNEAHALADALLHAACEGEASAPPPDPAEGQAWLVAPDAEGEWAGQDGKLAAFQSGAWLFAAPDDGMRLFDRATGQVLLYRGGWQRPSPPVEPAGGATVDAEARAAIAQLIAALVEAGIFPRP